LSGHPDAQAIGAKAANLLRLRQMGFAVPSAHVVPWQVAERCAQGDQLTTGALREELARLARDGRPYAVRSSADVEDSFERSYAGQFGSRLDVNGAEALFSAVQAVARSAASPTAQAYSDRRGQDAGEPPPQPLRMSVLIQEMVPPVVSGVSFSRNPLTGIRQTVVEAVAGPGTALLQEGVTPHRWVYHGGRFTSQPESEDIPLDLIAEVVAGTRRAARRARTEVDLEWVWDGAKLHWVQMRGITTLAQTRVYSNRLAREMLGGLIKPLVWSVSVPLVNNVWIDLLTEIVGPNELTAEDLARQFAYRTYFNMGLLGEVFESIGFPAESLEIMWGLVPRGDGKMRFRPRPQALRIMPRLIRSLWHKWRLPAELDAKLPVLEANLKAIDREALASQSPAELLAGIDALYDRMREAAYYNITAPLSAMVYTHLLRRALRRARVDFATLDMELDAPAFQRFDPARRLTALHRMWRDLPGDLGRLVGELTYEQLQRVEGLRGFGQELELLLADFGHLSDSGNDFSRPSWREQRDLVLRMILDQAPASPAGTAAASRVRLDHLRLPALRRRRVRALYRRARQFALYREHISYLYTLGIGRMREYFLALGEHLVQAGALATADETFYLTHTELRAAVAGSLEPAVAARLVTERRAEMETARDLVLPELIYGDEMPPPQAESLRRLTGTATSRGYCQGKAKVVTGLGEFDKVQRGDVLVIPYSDVSWTPLFARAAGVVAESGGILSHSSIVAREFGIPAVVSVTGAMQLKDDMLLAVDGYRGEVSVLGDAHTDETSDDRGEI